MSARKLTGKQVAIDVLRRERRAMTADEITEHVLRTEGVNLTGKTPNRTIGAQLYVEAKKPEGVVELVGRGTFRLRGE
jgi:hypothetical protein